MKKIFLVLLIISCSISFAQKEFSVFSNYSPRGDGYDVEIDLKFQLRKVGLVTELMLKTNFSSKLSTGNQLYYYKGKKYDLNNCCGPIKKLDHWSFANINAHLTVTIEGKSKDVTINFIPRAEQDYFKSFGITLLDKFPFSNEKKKELRNNYGPVYIKVRKLEVDTRDPKIEAALRKFEREKTKNNTNDDFWSGKKVTKKKENSDDFWSGKQTQKKPVKTKSSKQKNTDFWNGKTTVATKEADKNDFWNGKSKVNNKSGKDDFWSGKKSMTKGKDFKIKNKGELSGVVDEYGNELIPFKKWKIKNYEYGIAEVKLEVDKEDICGSKIITYKLGFVNGKGEFLNKHEIEFDVVEPMLFRYQLTDYRPLVVQALPKKKTEAERRRDEIRRRQNELRKKREEERKKRQAEIRRREQEIEEKKCRNQMENYKRSQRTKYKSYE